MNITVETNIDEEAEKLANDTEQYKQKLALQVYRALTVLETEIKQQIRKKSGLHVRTGALLNSIGGSKKVIEDGKGNIYGEIGPEGIPYDKIHEFGGVIRPKNKQFLAIPAPENQRPDGLPKITTQELMNGLGKSFISKGTIFMEVAGKKGSVFHQYIAMFFLRKEVTIPARPYLSSALAAKKDQLLRQFGLYVNSTYRIEGGE